MREIEVIQCSDGVVAVIRVRGYEYKHRGKRPKAPPVADIPALTKIFSTALSPICQVSAVEQYGGKIILILEESI